MLVLFFSFIITSFLLLLQVEVCFSFKQIYSDPDLKKINHPIYNNTIHCSFSDIFAGTTRGQPTKIELRTKNQRQLLIIVFGYAVAECFDF